MSQSVDCESTQSEDIGFDSSTKGSKKWPLRNIQFLENGTTRLVFEFTGIVANLTTNGAESRLYLTFTAKSHGYFTKIPAHPVIVPVSLIQKGPNGPTQLGDVILFGAIYLECGTRTYSLNESIDPLLYELVDSVTVGRMVNVALSPC